MGTCTACGASLSPGMAACSACGALVGEGPTTAPPPPSAAPAPEGGQPGSWSAPTPDDAVPPPNAARPPRYAGTPGAIPYPPATGAPPPGPGAPSGYGQPAGYGAPQGYGAPPGYGYGYGAPTQMDHPSGTTVLVLGILGFVACQLLAPVAWYLGNKALREIDAAPGRYSNRGSVQAGRILGIIGTVIIILYLVMGLVFLVGIVSLGTTSSSSSGSSGYRYLNSSTTLEQCKTDTKVLKTALVAWNTEYLSGDNSNYRTPWPEYEAQLTESGTQLLEEESRLHNLVGGGTTAPRIVKAPGMCLDEEIVQLN